jgi:hypothetical protein
MTATWPGVGDNLTTKDSWTAGNAWVFRAAGWQTDAHFIGAAAAWVLNTQFGHDWGWRATWLTAGIKTATASCGRIGSHGGQQPTGYHHSGQSNFCVEAEHLLHPSWDSRPFKVRVALNCLDYPSILTSESNPTPGPDSTEPDITKPNFTG